jgi:hypothetical protein
MRFITVPSAGIAVPIDQVTKFVTKVFEATRFQVFAPETNDQSFRIKLSGGFEFRIYAEIKIGKTTDEYLVNTTRLFKDDSEDLIDLEESLKELGRSLGYGPKTRNLVEKAMRFYHKGLRKLENRYVDTVVSTNQVQADGSVLLEQKNTTVDSWTAEDDAKQAERLAKVRAKFEREVVSDEPIDRSKVDPNTLEDIDEHVEAMLNRLVSDKNP